MNLVKELKKEVKREEESLNREEKWLLKLSHSA